MVGFIFFYLYSYRPLKQKQKIFEDVKMKTKVQSIDQLNELANVKVLQSQMSPHFLYNTLDIMSWISRNRGMPEVGDIAVSLSNISVTPSAALPLQGLRMSFGILKTIW